MSKALQLTPWQYYRTRWHHFFVAVTRRLTVGVRVVILDGTKVLLIRHTYLPGWHFPGGGVEPGETAQFAGAREALEETGYAPVGSPVLHGLYLNKIAGNARDHVAVYLWRAAEQRYRFKPNAEIAACGWFSLDALPDDVEAGTARRLAEIASGAPGDGAEW